MMFTVTEKAQEEVRNQLEGKETMPIRVFLHNGGCGGPQMAMALDEKKDTDSIFTFGEMDYLVDKEFLEQAQPICVDFIETGFKITSSIKLGGGCSSCGSTGSCCS